MTQKPNVRCVSSPRLVSSRGTLRSPPNMKQVLAETEDEQVELWTAWIRDGQKAAG
jgi:hypothetical protein